MKHWEKSMFCRDQLILRVFMIIFTEIMSTLCLVCCSLRLFIDSRCFCEILSLDSFNMLYIEKKSLYWGFGSNTLLMYFRIKKNIFFCIWLINKIRFFIFTTMNQLIFLNQWRCFVKQNILFDRHLILQLTFFFHKADCLKFTCRFWKIKF